MSQCSRTLLISSVSWKESSRKLKKGLDCHIEELTKEQVYSCEYQSTVNDRITTCLNAQLDAIPFWLSPDSVSAGCSCNLGKVVKSGALSVANMDQCGMNSTTFEN
jgi:hypothetical protein